jgi:hypothetical protein
MRAIKTNKCVVILTVFISVSLQAQNLNSRSVSKVSSSYLSSLSAKASSGNTEAQVRLGLAYQFGEGVQRNLVEAMKWLQIAADHGDSVAQTNLGCLYDTGAEGSPDSATRLARMLRKGAGIGQDLQEAVKLWTMAADHGNAYAQFDLAEIYMHGAGVPRDLDKALDLFTLAGKTLDVSKQMNELSSEMDEAETVKLR